MLLFLLCRRGGLSTLIKALPQAPVELGASLSIRSLLGEYYDMDKRPGLREPSRTSSVNGRSSATRYVPKEFVRYELDKAQQQECKAWAISEGELLSAMGALIDDGYKFTVKFDAYNECYACFMQCEAEDGPNAGFILTSRGSSAAKAVKQILFKHHTALDGDWSSYVERVGRDVLDD